MNKRIIIICTILIATSIITSFVTKSENIKLNKSFSLFPKEFNSWKGQTSELDDDIYNLLGVEDYIMSDYRSDKGAYVNLYVGFYQSQKEGDIIHSPKNCMPGAGWKITETSLIDIQLTDSGKTSKVIKLLLQMGDRKQVVLYWYQSRGRIISSEYMQKIWLVYDSITKRRTDGSFVRLITPVQTDEDKSLDILKQFAKEIYPYLNEYIPT